MFLFMMISHFALQLLRLSGPWFNDLFSKESAKKLSQAAAASIAACYQGVWNHFDIPGGQFFGDLHRDHPLLPDGLPLFLVFLGS